MEPAQFEATRIESFIKELDEKQLLYLNHIIVERLRLIAQERTVRQMRSFNPGEMVEFIDREGMKRQAMVVRLNTKTATVVTIDGQRWNVAPSLLRSVEKQ